MQISELREKLAGAAGMTADKFILYKALLPAIEWLLANYPDIILAIATDFGEQISSTAVTILVLLTGFGVDGSQGYA